MALATIGVAATIALLFCLDQIMVSVPVASSTGAGLKSTINRGPITSMIVSPGVNYVFGPVRDGMGFSEQATILAEGNFACGDAVIEATAMIPSLSQTEPGMVAAMHEVSILAIRNRCPTTGIVVVPDIPRARTQEYVSYQKELMGKVRSVARRLKVCLLDLTDPVWGFVDRQGFLKSIFRRDENHFNDKGNWSFMKVLREPLLELKRTGVCPVGLQP